MQHKKTLILLLQVIIFYSQQRFAASKAFIGTNIQVAGIGEFRSVVCIVEAESVNGVYNEYVLCTGTLVSTYHVLTAAHCLASFSLTVALIVYGAGDVREGTRLHMQWWITYNQWIAAIGIDESPAINDISMIKLFRNVDRRMVPVDLCPAAINRLDRLNVVAVGCGASQPIMFPTNLEKAELQILPHSECQERSNAILGYYLQFERNDICTVADPVALLSNGDSGGPLYYRNYLVAINLGNYPNVYGHFHELQVNYHAAIDFYRHYISSMLDM